MSDDFENEWSEEEAELDKLIENVKPRIASAEARQKIEALRERLELKEMEADPLMDTLIF